MRYRASLVRLRTRLPKNNQKGFTLIELLVVISILGILAAVVTMSLVGITAIATQRAGKTEANTVQVAYDTMLADRQVDSGHACPGSGPGSAGTNPPGTATSTNDMMVFPSTSTWTPDLSASSVGVPVQLYPHYLRENQTHGHYYCTGSGQIIQSDYTP